MAVPIDLAPADLAGYEDARRALSTQLVAWGQAAGRRLDPDTGEQLLHYKWGYLDDYLARWHCGDLDKILLELFPAKMLLAPDEAAAMIDETRTFLTFLSEAGFLDPGGDSVAVLWRHLSRIGPQMGRRLGDPSSTAGANACGWRWPRRASRPTTPAQSTPGWQAFTPFPCRPRKPCSAGPCATSQPGRDRDASHPLRSPPALHPAGTGGRPSVTEVDQRVRSRGYFARQGRHHRMCTSSVSDRLRTHYHNSYDLLKRGSNTVPSGAQCTYVYLYTNMRQH